MHLSALELAGFKSFASKTRLTFEPGMTCIVGPNGSGKSGTADAIRWVLGEQSLKSIRAKRGEDVIFAGSRTRPRLGMAEVSLTLADAEGSGLDTSELEVTRRVDRGGMSEYLVNGRPVRLLDLADLLARSGFAQKSYTVIPQGMSDAFVTASPQERRQMFEDATGVTPLLLKIQQTERKLETTKTQVLRARDLLRELEPRLRMLKRSATRARSRAEVETELRSVEERYAAHRFLQYENALLALRSKFRSVEEQIRAVTGNLEALPGERGTLQATDVSELPKLRQRLEHLQREERDLLLALAVVDQGGEKDVDRVAEEMTARTKEREKLENELGEILAAAAALRADLQHADSELAQLQERMLEGNAAPTGVPGEQVSRMVLRAREHVLALLTHLRSGTSTANLAALTREAEALERILTELAEQTSHAPMTSHGARILAPTVERLKTRLSEKDTLVRRLTALEVREASLRERIRAVEERRSALRALDAKHEEGESASSTGTSVAETRRRLPSVQRELADVRATVTRVEDLLLRTHTERLQTEDAARRLREELHRLEQERSGYAAEEAALNVRWEDLLREIRERLGAEFQSRLESHRVQAEAVSDAERLRADIERLRKRIFEIGEIDPAILQEEEEVDRRVSELRAQIADLETARRNLQEALKELSRHIHDRFAGAFRAMNEAFNRHFREVFGGGHASLSLVKPHPIEHAFPDLPPDEAKDLPREASAEAKWGQPSEHIHELPAGVEIHVHPPGKKLQSLSQLSGGEKALTSIALLFAVLSERASPFVVLDEVDAALDEANSRRFARLLQDLSRHTQFIVITHNRATMEAAQALYGVTMGDDGVSQLLSIKLESVGEEPGHTAAVVAERKAQPP